VEISDGNVIVQDLENTLHDIVGLLNTLNL
jgi:hypothetical protein